MAQLAAHKTQTELTALAAVVMQLPEAPRLVYLLALTVVQRDSTSAVGQLAAEESVT